MGVDIINTPSVEISGEPIERITQGLRTITTDHASIHAGEGFEASFIKETIADDGKYNISFKPPTNGTYIHFKLWKVWVSNAKVYVRIYETVDANVTLGTAVTPANKNRTSTTTSQSVLKEGVTFDETGAVLLDVDIFGSGGTTPQTRQGGEGDKDIEWVFCKTKNYIFQFENKSGGNVDILLNAFWYEEGDA